MNSRLPIFIIATLSIHGCDDCPSDPHVIRSLRVLGALVDPPVAAPGGAVTVRLLVADIEDRSLEVRWHRCPAPLYAPPADAGVLAGLGAPNAAPISRCLSTLPFATGTTVRVPIDDLGGLAEMSYVRPWRRWTDLVGFACAGGDIEPPPESGAWPRCSGARGVVFTASIPGPAADGGDAPPSPAVIEDLVFGPRGSPGAPWTEADPPVVPRCETARAQCPRWEFRFRVPSVSVVLELTGESIGALGGLSRDSVAYVNYHVTDAYPVSGASCSADYGATLRNAGPSAAQALWVAPPVSGDVTFWITARRASGGLTVQRRVVRVR